MTSSLPALRLTPSNSPFFKSTTPRSPTKTPRSEEPGLHLNKVIGTTTATANAFDALPSAARFAFTAGAAAVVAHVDNDLNVTQHFFRATPASTHVVRDPTLWPLSPSPNDSRHRPLGSVKEQVASPSPTNSSAREWLDSPGRSTSAKDRVKAATSVALSPNGRWVAVGETGYKPRILIFAAGNGSSESPVAILSEHTFGVHALTFSPDSRSLASLGTVNDGFLHVWNIDDRSGAATLTASNKCTTIVNVMLWIGRSILTAGLRFVKVWRPDDDAIAEARVSDTVRVNALATPRNRTDRLSDFGNSILSPKHRALAGKNSLLGDLIDATFTCAVVVSDSKAILCTDTGEICLLDDRDKQQALTSAVNVGIRITAARIEDPGIFHGFGADGHVSTYLVPDLERRAGASGKPRRQSGTPIRQHSHTSAAPIAVATVGVAVVEIDSNRVIKLSRPDSNRGLHGEVFSRRLTAHEGAVLGVRAFNSSQLLDAAFLTFSVNGAVHFWNAQGESVTSGLTLPVDDSSNMYGLPNELKAVAPLVHGTMLASGDKYGTISLVEVKTGHVLQQLRAHSAEVLDIVAFERRGTAYLASASRDRTVQLFMLFHDRLELLQTMDEHASAVTGLLVAHDGSQLLSCSADRSIVVREGILRDPNDPGTLAFGMLRAIALKSAPTCMCFTSQVDSILVSTVDRCIGKYSTRSAQPGFSFKCADNEGGEAVVLSKIVYTASLHGNPTIAGVSSSDKSVRLYTEYGSLIARDWGHTEGITDIALVPISSSAKDENRDPPRVATVAADSTIFLWDSIVPSVRSSDKWSGGLDAGSSEEQSVNASTPLAPPLRKVISHSEMSRIRRDKSTDERDSPSPTSNALPVPPVSPQKIRKKTSRLSLAQTPRLEPGGSRSNFDPSRRRSLKPRSPSPPSPRNANKKDLNRRPSLGMSLRSKSTDNLVSPVTPNAGGGVGFGSLNSSTASASHALRLYRKKLVNSSSGEKIGPDALRELEKELKLTARALSEKSQGRTIDEATMAKLLEQASDKIVTLLDEKIRARVEDEVRRNGETSDPGTPHLDPPAEVDESNEYIQGHIERSDTAPGALETRKLDS